MFLIGASKVTVVLRVRETAMSVNRKPSKKDLYRHGDVLVEQVKMIPTDAVKQTHLVLAEGELTGHVHRIAEKDSAELYRHGSNLYLRVLKTAATLLHQEHGPISLPQGEYRIWRQREYSPREIRVVRD
jgi:hypothetical protein